MFAKLLITKVRSILFYQFVLVDIIVSLIQTIDISYKRRQYVNLTQYF